MASKRVLMIDDEEDICEVAQVSLELMTDLELILAHTGATGIQMAQQEQPDAILLDVMLPDMDGISIFHALQDNPSTRSIPVILLTARVQAEDQQRFSELAVKAVIAKPFKPATLAEQVTTLLSW
ncbi:MAG: response regulator [Cyanobacteria bacterium P01_H01_bin.121]